MDYQLLDEKWIPVLYQDGRFEHIGILKAFSDAGRIRQIAANNPMDRFAVLRFMLALLYWCKGNPPENDEFVFKGSFPEEWFKKIHDNRDLFNLLGDGRRFYQTKKRNDGKKKVRDDLSANYLIHEIPTGTNYNHFRHSADGVDGLCPACCAVGLLRLPVFSTSGGRGKPKGINQVPPFYAVPVGRSLAETLWLSWKRVPHKDFGIPAWENPGLQLPEIGEVPLLTGLTWLPRYVWLGNPEKSKSYCISCGNKANLIKKCIFSGKEKKSGLDLSWTDPHAIQAGKEIIRPANAIEAPNVVVSQWIKVIRGIIEGIDYVSQRIVTKIWVVGLASVVGKYIETIEYEIPFYGLHDMQRDKLLGIIKKWQKKSFSKTVSDIREILKQNKKKVMKSTHKSSKSNTENAKITSIVNAICPNIEHRVSTEAHKMIADSNEWIKAANKYYHQAMEIISESLCPGFTSAAVNKKRQISSLVHME